MAYPIDHKNDTIRAIGNSTSEDNAELIRELVHMIIDGQATNNGKEECSNLLTVLENRGIVTKHELHERFIKEGVDITNCTKKKKEQIDQFLVNWLLPPHGPNHQLYTHKGWNYDYSREEDKDYWNALEIKQSWEVKKYLFVTVIKKIYSLPESKAEALSVLLYNVHRLRDIQYNNYDESTAAKKKYLFNACDELEKYVLPLITDKDLKEQIHIQINRVKETLSKITGPINDDFWQGLNGPIDKLLGSIDYSGLALVSTVAAALSR
jgi:hypothetical protein